MIDISFKTHEMERVEEMTNAGGGGGGGVFF
jgi:hypothetical protein